VKADDLEKFVRQVLNPQSGLKSTDRLVVIALGLYASSTGVAWPAVGTLAAVTGQDPTTVRKALRRLEQAGVLKVGPQRDGWGSRTYVIARELLPVRSAACSDQTGPTDNGELTPPTGPPVDLDGHPQNPPQELPAPPPPGKRPAESSYSVRYEEGGLFDVPTTQRISNKQEDSEGETPEGRKDFDPEDAARFYERLSIDFSYFLADQLIARRRKKPQYRDDALSKEWWWPMQNIVWEEGCLQAISIAELETAIERFLDTEEGQYVRRPGDLRTDGFDTALCEVKRERAFQLSASPAPSLRSLSAQDV
jgi:hypothetical protein